ncbi:MAG: glycoside hydrolase family 127 protein [Phycisphaerales bacterium]|nr:glycoside hydrolase family 127 protein [Phycisphaerales bacterium]
MTTTYESFPLGQIRPLGWMLLQMQRDLHGFAGHLDELTREASFDAFGENRKNGSENNAPPNPDATAWRWWWRGETEAVWLDGLVRMAFLAGDADAQAKAARILRHILAFQEPDGYIGVYKPSDRYKHQSGNGELWTQSRIFVALLAYAEFTGDPTILPAVRRAVDLTMSKYGPPPLDRPYFRNPVIDGGVAHGLMFIDVLEILFHKTGERRYLEFAEFLFNDFASADNMPKADNRPVNLLDPAKPYDGHTPHVMEQIRVLLFLAQATGKDIYKQCVNAAFAKLARHTTVSAACIGDENIHGREPTGEMFYEYCAMTELLASLHSRMQKTGELHHADAVERLLFNAAQGARFADGMAITYLTQDNRLEASRALSLSLQRKTRTKFSPTHEDVAVCCNPAAVKILPYHVSGMFLRIAAPDHQSRDRKGATGQQCMSNEGRSLTVAALNAPGIAVAGYGPCRLSTSLAGKSLTLSQQTHYPFEDHVTIDIEQADQLDFTLELRIPAWSTRTVITVNNAPYEAVSPTTQIRRQWNTGDRLTIAFQPAITIEQSCDHQAVVVRGPLVFAAPIADRRTSVKDYRLSAFHDYDVFPVDNTSFHLSMPRDVSFDLCRCPENLSDPWTKSKSPLELRGTMLAADKTPTNTALIPMGCTTLRRVTFPWAP